MVCRFQGAKGRILQEQVTSHGGKEIVSTDGEDEGEILFQQVCESVVHVGSQGDRIAAFASQDLHGVLHPLTPLGLHEHQRVHVQIVPEAHQETIEQVLGWLAQIGRISLPHPTEDTAPCSDAERAQLAQDLGRPYRCLSQQRFSMNEVHGDAVFF